MDRETVQRCLEAATRQFRHNSDNSPDSHNPAEGFVFAYDIKEIDRLVAQLRAKAEPPTWTKEPPTKPGYYWKRWPASEYLGPEEPVTIKRDEHGNEYLPSWSGWQATGRSVSDHPGHEWAGPIALPGEGS